MSEPSMGCEKVGWAGCNQRCCGGALADDNKKSEGNAATTTSGKCLPSVT